MESYSSKRSPWKWPRVPGYHPDSSAPQSTWCCTEPASSSSLLPRPHPVSGSHLWAEGTQKKNRGAESLSRSVFRQGRRRKRKCQDSVWSCCATQQKGGRAFWFLCWLGDLLYWLWTPRIKCPRRLLVPPPESDESCAFTRILSSPMTCRTFESRLESSSKLDPIFTLNLKAINKANFNLGSCRRSRILVLEGSQYFNSRV